MIETLDIKDENILGYKIDGKIEKTDLQHVFSSLENKVKNNGKVKFYAEIKNFGAGDLTTEILKEDIKFWLEHPLIIPNIEKAVVVTDSDWIKTMFDVECALIPTLEGESFSFGEEEKALEWLRTDQREASRLDITFAELAETSMLKFAGGFALGLLTAGLFTEKQRKQMAAAILLGSFAAGIPLGIKVLNNNRQLFGK